MTIPNHSFWQSLDGKRQLFVSGKLGIGIAEQYRTTHLVIADFSKKQVFQVEIEVFINEITAGKLQIINGNISNT